jgi:hypothetical protein
MRGPSFDLLLLHVAKYCRKRSGTIKFDSLVLILAGRVFFGGKSGTIKFNAKFWREEWDN